MSWNQNGVFAPPGATGVPTYPQGQQAAPPQGQGIQYSPQYIPPPPGQGPYGPQNPYGVQPGVPGAQMAQPQQTMQPGQQWGVQPQYAQQPQAPQGWPQVPQPPQQQPQGAPQLRDDQVLQGPNVPLALQGRTVAQARQILQQQAAQPQAPAQAPQRLPPAAPAQQAQPERAGGTFWSNPEERIASLIDQRLGPMLSQSAKEQAQARIPDFAALEPHIESMFGQASDPSIRSNPEAWVMAARLVRGQLVESGQYNPQASPARPQVPQPQYGPGTSVPAQPLHSFFTEAPSAPGVYGMGGVAPRSPTSDDYTYANKFQMPIGDYMAWKYGVGPQQAGSY